MTGEHCPSCGGQWIDGRIAVPIVGSLRFVYRLGTNEVTTEVAARMCGCGRATRRPSSGPSERRRTAG